MTNTNHFARWTIHTHNKTVIVVGRLTLQSLVSSGIYADDIIAVEER